MLYYRLRFRFGDDTDVGQFGDGWFEWDEPALAQLRMREQIALEEVVGMPLLDIIGGLRKSGILATAAAMWIALHRAGRKVAWDDFNPVVLAAEWEGAPADPLDPTVSPDSGGDPAPDSGSSSPPPAESATS